MPQQQGTNTSIRVAPETTWGAAVSPAAGESLLIPFVSETMSYSRTTVDDPTITTARENKKPGRGEVSVDGDLSVRLNGISHPWLMKQAMGGYTAGQFGDLIVTSTTGMYVGQILQAGATGTNAPDATTFARIVDVTNATTLRLSMVNTAAGARFITGDDVFLHGTTGAGSILTAITTGFAEVTGLENVADHKLSISSLPIGFALQKYFPDIDNNEKVFEYTGCRINQYSVTLNPSGLLESTFSIMAKDEQQGLVGTLWDSPTEVPHVGWDAFDAVAFSEGLLRGTLGAAELDLSTDASVTAFSMTLNNNIDGGVRAVGTQGKRGALPAGKAAISGNMTLLFKNATFLNLAQNHTTTDLLISLRKAGTLDSQSDLPSNLNNDRTGLEGYEQMDIILPEVVFTPTSPAIDGPQGLSFSVDFSGFFDSAEEGTGMLIRAANLVPDYGTIGGMATNY